MPAPDVASPASSLRRGHVWLIVAGLLALYAALALLASTHKGLSFDEGEELAIGYNIWLRHDFRMEAANGDFIKRWATLPYLISRPAFLRTDAPDWLQGEPYTTGFRFFFNCGNDPAALLLQGRTMVVLLGIATGLLVFLCSREIFGDFGGLISLALFVFSPHMLAFGALVSTEMSVCLTLLGSTWCIWRLLHRITWGRLVGSLAVVSLLMLSKPTALVIFPITAVLLGVKLLGRQPLEWQLGPHRLIRSRSIQAGIFSAVILLHAVVSWSAIWAHYDFRYAASPHPEDSRIMLRKRMKPDPVDPISAASLAWMRRTHFMPEGFIHGAEWLLTNNDEREAFMNGQWATGGWRTFFPYAMWVKTPPAFSALLLLGIAAWWWRRHSKARPQMMRPFSRSAAAPPFYAAVPYVTLAGVYFGVAVIQNLNIGFRHILPIYPALDVLAGAAILLWSIPRNGAKVLLGALLLGLIVDSTSVYPNYLAYFNPFVGGTAQGYKHLVDSSLDWGMDLPALQHWLDQNNAGDRQPVFLAYFGTDNPGYYRIRCKRLPGFFDWRQSSAYPLTPGIYAISATLLQSVYTYTFGPWNKSYERVYQSCLRNLNTFEETAKDPMRREALIKKYPPGFWNQQYAAFEKLRFGRLCAWLRHRSVPVANAGHSILIWRLNAAMLGEALLGPPVELADHPVED